MTRGQSPNPQHCALCGRATLLQFHHLIPSKNHGKPWFRRHFTRQDMRSRGVLLCRLCHRFIHRQFDEQMLGRQLNTLEALRAEPLVRNHVQWAARQKVL